MKNFEKYLKSEIEKKTKENFEWNINKLFHKVKLLSPDQIGTVGENFLEYCFKQMDDIKSIKNIGNQTKDYDLIVDKIKIEVKTATRGRRPKNSSENALGTFQHEGIKNSNDWDMLALVDISPEDVSVLFFNRKRFEMKDDNFIVNHNFFQNNNKKLHNRGKDKSVDNATGKGYKFDLTGLQSSKERIENIEDIHNKYIKELKYEV